jgi:hypothetical protein
MARNRGDSDKVEELPAQDSFLDLVANIVGIMILLVVIVGIRAATSLTEEGQPVAGPSVEVLTAEKVRDSINQLHAVATEVGELELKAARLDQRADELDQHRIALIGYVDEVEQELARRREKLNEPEREEFDLRVAISQAEAELDEKMRERISLESGLTNTKTLRNVPTPIVRKAADNEVTLWVDEGRVAIVPFEELWSLVKADLERRLAVRHLPKGISEMALNGFVIRYAVAFRNLTLPTGAVVQQAGPVAQIRPEKGNPGEVVSEACEEGSRLMDHLKNLDPKTTTVTIWVRTSSFADAHPVREMVAKRGFSTAVWPRPEGSYIEISPWGSESQAQ